MNTKYLVIETIKYNKLKETNISMDRYFTSASVAKWALDEQSITIVGTMRHDRKGIPKELKMLDRREEKSAMYVYSEDDSMLVLPRIERRYASPSDLQSQHVLKVAESRCIEKALDNAK